MLRKLILPAIAALVLTGCGAPTPVGVAAGDTYYDGYYNNYGPFEDGYWGGDRVFWFQDRDGAWHHDYDGHFSHDAAPGFREVPGDSMHHVPG
jgi:hypothetical protein